MSALVAFQPVDRERRRRIVEHSERCRDLPPLQKGEAERLIAEYLERRQVTACQAAHVAPKQD